MDKTEDGNLRRRAVLDIDAAWTVKEPSGVAAAVETASAWRLAVGATSYEQCIARETGVEPGGERPRGSKSSAADPRRAGRRCGSLSCRPRARGGPETRGPTPSFKTSPGCASGLPLSQRRHRREIEPGPWPKTCVKICARSRSGENGRRLPWTILSFRRALLGIPFKRRARPKLPRSTIFGRPDAVSSPASSLPGALGAHPDKPCEARRLEGRGRRFA